MNPETTPARTPPAFGAMFSPRKHLEHLAPFARSVEEFGFEELWLAEDCFASGAFSSVSTALAVTKRTSVGIGLLPASVRNPAIVAMELASLSEMYPGRVRAAFGHGVDSWMRQIGSRPRNRLIVLDETLDVVTTLLRGEKSNLAGTSISMDCVQLDRPPRHPPPILVGTAGERTMRIAQERAHGLLLPEGASPTAISWAAELGESPIPVTAYVWLCLDDNTDRAYQRTEAVVERWRAKGRYPNLQSRCLVPENGPIPDAALADVAVIGSPEECAAAINRWTQAGARSIVLSPIGDDPVAQLRRFAMEVVPYVDAHFRPDETIRQGGGAAHDGA